MMKGLCYTKFGSPEDVLECRDDLSVPSKVGPYQLLIQVHASSINPIDWKLMGGLLNIIPHCILHHKPSLEAPAQTGMDLSGKVLQIGAKVTKFEVGDDIYGMKNWPGAMAEQVLLEESHAAYKPTSLSHVQAAALPLAALTSYQGLFHYGQLQAGQKILILGGSGGTGSLAIEMARDAGAEVIATTCSGHNSAFVKSLGATLVIDYHTTDFAQVLAGQDYDLVYDCVGGRSYWDGAIKVLKKEGIFVTLIGDEAEHVMTVSSLWAKSQQLVSRKLGGLFGWNPTYHLILTNPSGADLTAIGKLVETKKLHVTVDTEYELKDFQTAFAKSVQLHTKGKLVLKLKEDK